MRVAMGPVDGPRPVPVSDWHGLPESYAVSGHQGLTGMSVTITHPGTYLIETSDAHPAAVTDLAVGRSILRATVLPLVLIVAGLVALGGAVLVFVLTAVRRRRARRGLGQPPGETEALRGRRRAMLPRYRARSWWSSPVPRGRTGARC